MKKPIMACMALLMVLILASCKAPGGNTQTVFIWGTADSEIFKGDTASVSSELNEYVDNTVEKIKTNIRVGSSAAFDIAYQKTVEQNGIIRHVYKEVNDLATLRYFGDTQELAQIYFKAEVDSELGKCSTEEEYKRWAMSFPLFLGIKDNVGIEGMYTREYKYSCETRVVTSGADFAGQRTVEGFYIPKDDTETVSGYTFSFTKHLAGVPTSDKISIYVAKNTIAKNTIILNFDEKRFADTEAPELDMTACDEAVENFLNAKVDTKKYTLASYEAKDAYLTYIGEKLCLVYAVEMDLKDNVSGGTIATAQKVAVDVNAISK